jgi:hypothetical protein
MYNVVKIFFCQKIENPKYLQIKVAFVFLSIKNDVFLIKQLIFKSKLGLIAIFKLTS